MPQRVSTANPHADAKIHTRKLMYILHSAPTRAKTPTKHLENWVQMSFARVHRVFSKASAITGIVAVLGPRVSGTQMKFQLTESVVFLYVRVEHAVHYSISWNNRSRSVERKVLQLTTHAML